MMHPFNSRVQYGIAASLLGLLCLLVISLRLSSPSGVAQSETEPRRAGPPMQLAQADAEPKQAEPNQASGASPEASQSTDEPDPSDSSDPSDPSAPESNGIQLSFKGAKIEMVIQWLAETTGKSILKHPQVKCELTIVSSKKLEPRQAVQLVFRALSMEGFSTIESNDSILIVPEGKEPKLSPKMIDGSGSDIPEGRQRLVQVFQLENIDAGDLKDRVEVVLSENGSLEADDHANKLIATDYTENIRLLGELIRQLDVGTQSDSVIEIFPLKHAKADDLATLLNVILNEGTSARGSGSQKGGSSSPGPHPSQEIKLWPDQTTNRLIVTAPRSRISEVQNLIETLDAAKPADVAVRVLPLKNVSAEDLVEEIAPLYEKMSGDALMDMIEVTANNRSNSLIILSNEANFQSIQKLVTALDTKEAQEKVVRAFPLKNAAAEDVAEQLQELYQPSNNMQSRYIYYYGRSSGDQQKFSVVADRRRNTVVVQAAPSSMEGIEEMINVLDEPVEDESLAPRIFPLKYVSAADIESVLNELLIQDEPQRDYFSYYYSPAPEEDSAVGRLYGKVRITSEPYSNSIIVTANSQENLEAVEHILEQLDAPSQAGETTLRVGLNFANAITVANHLNILFAKGGSPPLRQGPQPQNQQNNRGQPQQQGSSESVFQLQKEDQEDIYYPWLGGQRESFQGINGTATRPVSDLIGRVRIVPDTRTNSLLITSNVHFFPQVIKLVNEMDVPTAQVLIEAKILEVSDDVRDRLGVRWSPDGSRTFDADDLDNSILGSGSATYQKVFAGSPMANALETGVLDSSVNLDVLIQFLRKNTESKILAEPQINVADNEMGKLFVGAQVPFISNSIITDQGGRSDSFQYRDVGIILEVTPHINNSDEVALKIRVESSNIRKGETLFGGAILDTRSFRTDMMVSSSQVLVLGGIIQEEDVDTVRKTPFLGDIPGLGWLFKKRDTINRNVELMVFLKPRIVRSPQQVEQIMDDLQRKTPRIHQWEQQKSDHAPAKEEEEEG